MYVQAMIDKGKSELSTVRLTKKKTLKRKTLTVQTPFELKTAKRVRIDEVPADNGEKYEPLWQQV